MRYFAYGSNMERVWMKKRCPGAKFVSAALLRDHDITFSRSSAMWGGGTADLKATPGGSVEGVLWEITEADLKSLDSFEGFPREYIRKTITVEAQGKSVEALVYVVVNPGGYRPPSRRYLRLLVQGAEEHGLSDRYVERLEAIRTAG